MAHDVFICYAKEDSLIADAVCQALEDKNVMCWYAPRDVPYGTPFEEAIIDAIYRSRLMLLILSKNSNASPHVEREITTACDEDVRLPVLPFRIEEVSLNKVLYYYIKSLQWLDASVPPRESHLQRLVAYVAKYLSEHQNILSPALAQEERLAVERQRKEIEERQKAEAEAARKAEEERLRREEEERRKREAEDIARQLAEEEEAERNRLAEQEAARLHAEAERARAEKERRLREEERKRKAEKERQRLEEEEKQRQKAAAILRAAEEERQRLKKEEERLRLLDEAERATAAENAAAQRRKLEEEAKRKAEEEQHKEPPEDANPDEPYDDKDATPLDDSQRTKTHQNRNRWIMLALVAAFTLVAAGVSAKLLIRPDRSSMSIDAPTINADRVKPIPAAPLTAADHANSGTALLNQEKYQEAEAEYKQAAELEKNNALYSAFVGIALAKQQKWKEAEPYFKRATELDGATARWHTLLGISLFNQGAYGAAENEFQAAVNIGARSRGMNYAHLHGNLADAFFAQRKWSKAIAEYKKAADLTARKVSSNEAEEERNRKNNEKYNARLEEVRRYESDPPAFVDTPSLIPLPGEAQP